MERLYFSRNSASMGGVNSMTAPFLLSDSFTTTLHSGNSMAYDFCANLELCGDYAFNRIVTKHTLN